MPEDFQKMQEEEHKRAEYHALPLQSYEDMVAVFNKWLLIVDPGVVKLTLATIIANKLPSDPVWLFLIAPSSGGKTEILNSLYKVPECYPLSQLTPNTFLSGYKNKEKTPSLLHRLGTGKTLIFKDFTTLLDGNADAFKEINGQFRELFDGKMIKVLGTGDEITWEGKLGFIAGCTPILEQRVATLGALGERFLSYYIEQPDRNSLRSRIKLNVGKEAEMRGEIQNAVAGYLKGIVVSELPQMPPDVDTMIDSLTDFVAISRAVVMRSRDSKRDIEYIVPPEMAGRIYKQFYTLALTLLIMNKGVWDATTDGYILKKLAISSIHSLRWLLIQHIASYKTKVKTATLAMELGYPTSTTRRYLEDLAAISMDKGRIKILNRTHQGPGKPDLWELTESMRNILVAMQENIEAVKEDKDFDQNETEIPMGEQAGDLPITPDEHGFYGA